MRVNEGVKRLLALYDRFLIESLKNASEEDVYVCSKTYDVADFADELGLDYVVDLCTICGEKVYRRNVDTKAVIVCEDCARNRDLI